MEWPVSRRLFTAPILLVEAKKWQLPKDAISETFLSIKIGIIKFMVKLSIVIM